MNLKERAEKIETQAWLLTNHSYRIYWDGSPYSEALQSLADEPFLKEAAIELFGGTREAQKATQDAGYDGSCGNHVLWFILVTLGVARVSKEN